MKRKTTLFLFLLAHLTLWAQDNKSDYQYQPFIMDGSCEWIRSKSYSSGATVNHITNEDTIISGNKYKKIYYYDCKTPNEREYRGAIREENKAIYYVSRVKDVNKEYKIFDFNLKVGDKVEYTHPENWEIYDHMTLEVSKIDTVKFNNTWRRVYSFSDYTYEKYTYEWADEWIEGIGANLEFLIPFKLVSTCCDGSVCGVTQNDDLIHGNHTCASWAVGIENNNAPQFNIIRNPIENKVLSIAMGESKFNQIDIYSMTGKHVFNKNIASHAASLDIQLNNLEVGSYVVILTKENGDRASDKIIIL